MRYLVVTLFVLFLCAYAWKDWYRSLCGMMLLMVIIGHDAMPRSLFGIAGLNLFNLLFINVVLSWLMSRKKEQLKWDMPAHIKLLLCSYLLVVFVALLRYTTNQKAAIVLEWTSGVARPSVSRMYVDYFFNSIKWVLPGLLLYSGCNSKERFNWGIASLILMYTLLALLVIRWMPLGVLTDGDTLQRRAIRVLDRELGYYRTNLAVMLGGGFWLIMISKSYFKAKYGLIIYGCAGVCLLGMVLTGGRGGYVACALVGLIVCCTKYRRYLLLVPPVIALVIVFVPAVKERVFHGLGDSARVEYATDVDGNVDDNNLGTITAGRSILWPLSWEQAVKAPLLGHGFWGMVNTGVSLELYQRYRSPYRHPHNAYLQLFLDNGIIGSLPILLFYYLIVKYAWSLFKDRRSKIYVMAGGAGFAIVMTVLLASLTGQSFYPEERSFGLWCAIGLVLRVYVERVKLEGRKESHKKKIKQKAAPARLIWDEEPVPRPSASVPKAYEI